MLATLPNNDGATQVLKFEKVGKQIVRNLLADGVFPELEYGLLKGTILDGSNRSTNDQALGWGIEDKSVLLNLEIETLKATQGLTELTVEVRCLCYSRGVTADYLEDYQKWNMKQCLLILGDVGKAKAPWAELIQAAVYLHRKEFNILWIEVPAWVSNPVLWLRYGADIVSGTLRFLRIEKTSVIAKGTGGGVFVNAASKSPDIFNKTHFIFNIDQPPGKGVFINAMDLEDVLRSRTLQIWFTFRDDEVYDRGMDGSPQKAYDAINKLASRLAAPTAGAKLQKGKPALKKTYDEILMSENLNINPAQQHVSELRIGPNNIIVWSRRCLDAISVFLELAPGTRQDSLVGGLIGDFRSLTQAKASSVSHNLQAGEENEPLSLRRLRIGPAHGLRDRPERARANRSRLELLDTATRHLTIAPEALRDGTMSSFQDGLIRRLEDIRSDSKSSIRSRGTVQSRASMHSLADRATARRSTTQSRTFLKEQSERKSNFGPALPALMNSASSPGFGTPAFADSDGEEDSEDEGLLDDVEDGAPPWQQYRKQWQQMHGKKPPAYTHPIR